jgi:hypothetical protein
MNSGIITDVQLQTSTGLASFHTDSTHCSAEKQYTTYPVV